MTQAGAIRSPRAASNRGRDWRRADAPPAERVRKSVVVASLMLGDFVAATAALSLSRAVLNATGVAQPLTYFPAAFLILTFFLVRLYTACGPSPYERFRLRTIGIMGFAGIDFLMAFPASRLAPLLVAALSNALLLLIFGHYVEAMIRALLIRLGMWGASTALVGCGDKSRRLAHLLTHEPAFGLTPVGFVETPRDEPLHNSSLALPLIGGTNRFPPINSDVEFVVFTSADELSTFASDFRRVPSCRLLLVEDMHDLQSVWLRTRTLGEAIGIEIRRGLGLRHNQLTKRIIDLLLSIPMMLLALPIIAVLALMIKIVDPGPAFYVQHRIGRNGTTLRTFKLRTMYPDAERRLEEQLSRDPLARAEWNRCFKLSQDPRVLPIIGNFMRRASLDELPQLWNVIRGDMSLVGPRPFPAYHLSSFDDEFRAIRSSVPPGITGMWQVSSRSNGDLQVQKTQDLFYIRNWSIWLDVYILLQTVLVVLSAKGAR